MTAPIELHVHEFDDATVRATLRAVQRVIRRRQSTLPVYVCSYGGDIARLCGILDALSACPVPVATIALGGAYSCGAVLLASGTRGHRWIGPNASAMVHEAMTLAPITGSTSVVTVEARDLAAASERMLATLDRGCGKRPGYWRRALKRRGNTDWYLTAAQAVKLGLADHIGAPVFVSERRTVIKGASA